MTISKVVATGGVAIASAALLLLTKRLRIRRYLNQLPLLQLGPNQLGISATVSPVGATITKLIVPAADGSPVDVVLGFERASTYAVRRVLRSWSALPFNAVRLVCRAASASGPQQRQQGVKAGRASPT